MERRKFIKTGIWTSLSPLIMSMPVYPGVRILPRESTEDQHFFKSLIDSNDQQVADLLKKQQTREDQISFGGLPDAFGIYTAGGTAAMISTLVVALISPDSKFYRSDDLLKPLIMAAHFMARIQHEDGTIDLHTTNFHSPPDTGFVLEHICSAYDILKENRTDLPTELMDNLKLFILNGGKALSVGGIHTPNHRWVICQALARINALFPNQTYIDRIEEWLGEKIDIDPDGQFTEKSTAIYSPLTDRCLITIARLLDKPELYEPVRKNLNMTMYYVHSDGEIVTQASRRQDQYQKGSMAAYYYPYRYMALLDNNRYYAAMARSIQETASQKLTGTLVYFTETPSLKGKLPPNDTLPTNYKKEFPYSGLVRIRREQISATILASNTTFFTYRNGPAILEGLRFASAFFGKGQFEGEALIKSEDGYLLQQMLRGPYYQPFPESERPGDGNWNKMNRALRPQSEIQELTSRVLIKEESGRFKIFIEIAGTDHVPVAVEYGFRSGGELNGVTRLDNIPDAYLLENGWGEYRFEDQTIRFGPGMAGHVWTQLRGAAPKLNAMCVYMTGFTPFKHTIEIS